MVSPLALAATKFKEAPCHPFLSGLNDT